MTLILSYYIKHARRVDEIKVEPSPDLDIICNVRQLIYEQYKTTLFKDVSGGELDLYAVSCLTLVAIVDYTHAKKLSGGFQKDPTENLFERVDAVVHNLVPLDVFKDISEVFGGGEFDESLIQLVVVVRKRSFP